MLQGEWLVEVALGSPEERRVPREWLKVCGTKKVGLCVLGGWVEGTEEREGCTWGLSVSL